MHSACQDAHWHSWLSAACAAREYEERKCGPCGMSSGKEPEYLCVAKVFYPTSLPSCFFHFSTLFSMPYFGGVWQSSLQTLLYLFPLFIYSCLGTTSSIPEANVFATHTFSFFDIPHPIFYGSLFKRRWKRPLEHLKHARKAVVH